MGKTLLTDFKVGDIPLQEHPRPQFKRDDIEILNGLWDYSVVHSLIEELQDFTYDGKILVPFCIESYLSQVQKKFLPTDTLVYRRTIKYEKINKRTILHFDAIDYRSIIFLNGEKIYENVGGYFHFAVDITTCLKEGDNELVVLVQDPSNSSFHQRGKQKINGSGIWYTPTSGIWQTVWLERVPFDYITSIKLLPNVDDSAIDIATDTFDGGNTGTIEIYQDGIKILTHNGRIDNIRLSIKSPKLWTPEYPHLYDVVIKYKEDVVNTYFALRKVELKNKKFYLNNKPCFLTGLLDQGYYPDGLLTPPSEEAMIFDIKFAKEYGFNVLRKHIKIEPMRWYYLCDKLGMIVWQDMLSGGADWSVIYNGILPFINVKLDDRKHLKAFGRDKLESRIEFEEDFKRMINQLYNVPSICLWGIFNEAWGQFESKRFNELLLSLDKSRVIDQTSGWFNQGTDPLSLHVYFTKFKMPKKEERTVMLTEFGGYSTAIKDHVFDENKVFGYRVYKELDKFKEAVYALYDNVITPAVSSGLAACIYTQITDVEQEINGLVTYDRKVVKIDKSEMLKINQRLRKLGEFNK